MIGASCLTIPPFSTWSPPADSSFDSAFGPVATVAVWPSSAGAGAELNIVATAKPPPPAINVNNNSGMITDIIEVFGPLPASTLFSLVFAT